MACGGLGPRVLDPHAAVTSQDSLLGHPLKCLLSCAIFLVLLYLQIQNPQRPT